MNFPFLKSAPEVAAVFAGYPPAIRPKMETLRNLVLAVAQSTEGITHLEETLKWGEPSYLAPKGSTLRMDWKSKTPRQYALYLKCTSRLVETFRMVFPTTFEFAGNRAILFSLELPVPVAKLKLCIRAALQCHSVKHLPTLGIG